MTINTINIVLPKKGFIRYNDDTQTEIVAYVVIEIYYDEETGEEVVIYTLYMKKEFPFKELMRELAYEIQNSDVCPYCGKKVTRKQQNVDHIIPQDLGGPSLTNNFIIVCKTCNTAKSNLLPEQFQKWKKIVDPEKKKNFFKKCQNDNQKYKYDKTYPFLEEFGVNLEFPINEIHGYEERISYFNPTSNKMTKQERVQKYYEKYGRFQKAIIVDRNYYLLAGYETLMCAINEGLEVVPVIILENVEVVEKIAL